MDVLTVLSELIFWLELEEHATVERIGQTDLISRLVNVTGADRCLDELLTDVMLQLNLLAVLHSFTPSGLEVELILPGLILQLLLHLDQLQVKRLEDCLELFGLFRKRVLLLLVVSDLL